MPDQSSSSSRYLLCRAATHIVRTYVKWIVETATHDRELFLLLWYHSRITSWRCFFLWLSSCMSVKERHKARLPKLRTAPLHRFIVILILKWLAELYNIEVIRRQKTFSLHYLELISSSRTNFSPFSSVLELYFKKSNKEDLLQVDFSV